MSLKLTLLFVTTAASLVICFFLTELGFRLYGYWKGVDFRLYRKELTNSDRLPEDLFVEGALKPNAEVLATTSDFSVVYALNSLGFRDQEYELRPPEGKTRVLMLGDSFTFGEGIPYGQRFDDILEKKLPSLEVINFGIPGYGIDGMYMKYIQVGRNLQPDYVVVVLNSLITQRFSLDILRDGKVDVSWIQPDQLPIKPHDDVYRRDDERLKNAIPFSKSSYFLSYLDYQLTVRRLRKQMTQFDEGFWTSTHDEFEPEKDLDTANQVDERTILVLNALRDDVKQAGGKLVVINIDDQLSFEEVMSQVADVPYFNYQPRLVDLAQKQPLTFRYDLHYNPQTAAQIGSWLTTDFESLLLR